MIDLRQFAKPFADVTVNTFRNFVGCELMPKYPYFTDDEVDLQSDITGVISISGALHGVVTISMKMEIAKKITGKLIHAPSIDIDVDTDVVDAIGEITSIIAGNAKQRIPGGDSVVISLPTVVMGQERAIVWMSHKRKILCIPFAMNGSRIFNIMVSFGVDRPDMMEYVGE